MPLTHSQDIGEIAAALALAQKEIEGAKKDSDNPFFRSRYADLASVWDACREPLTKNGIAVVQSPSVETLGEATIIARVAKSSGEERDVVRVLTRVTVTTLLTHKSGQWFRDEMSCTLPTSDPQPIGSGTTYLRRYSLAAMAGVAPEDDDAETATGRGNGHHDAGPYPLREGQSTVVKVLDVRQKPGKSKSGKPYIKFTIKTSDGRDYGTFDKAHAEAAKAAREAAQYVELTYSESQYGRDVMAITEKLSPTDAEVGGEEPPV